MPLPVMTPEQRAANLLKAREVRTARAALLAQLKAGRVSAAELLDRADSDPVVGKTRVAAVLRAVPGIGPVAADRILGEVRLTDARVLKALNPKQRAALLDSIGASITGRPA